MLLAWPDTYGVWDSCDTFAASRIGARQLATSGRAQAKVAI
jgi:hypothetical protein